MKYYCSIVAILLSMALSGQETNYTQEQEEVYEVIVRLFDGMRAGDSSMVHSVFSDEARMYSSFKDGDGALQLKEGSLTSFLKAIGTPHDEIWDEKIWNTKVNVELGVAQVWTDYAFYVGTEFSHCGIDAFHLVREADSWKIIHLMDTRRKMNCEKPK